MRFPRFAVVVRWLLAGLAGGGGVFELAHVLATEGNMMAAFAKSLFGLAALISAVLFVSPEAVGWAVLPLHRLLDSLFLPSESAPPPVDFNLARFYAKHLRYEEACQEYEKIIRYHPEQTTAYLEGIQAAAQAGDEQLAGKFHRAARRVLRSEVQRGLVENVYAARHALPASGDPVGAADDASLSA